MGEPLPKSAGPDEELLLRTEQLAFFLELSGIVISSMQFESILEKILDATRRVLGADACLIRLLEAGSNTLRLVASSGLSPDYASKAQVIRVGESILGRAVEECRPVAVVDIYQSPYKFRDLARVLGLRSLLAVPIIARDQLLGGIAVFSRNPHVYTSMETRLLSAIAGQAAVAIDNAHLRENAYNAIHSLARAIEARDPYTKGHSDRTARYALILARALRVSPQQEQLISLLAPLHDVGKVAISEGLLHKTGPLSAIERKMIARHCTTGVEILRPMRLFEEGLTIIRHHHEWVNGAGYPDGMTGEKLSAITRVTSVADAFDAMTSDRPYRKALSVEAAVAELKSKAGIQFDREMALLFARIAERREFGIDIVLAQRETMGPLETL